MINTIDLNERDDQYINSFLLSAYKVAEDYRYEDVLKWKILQGLYDGKSNMVVNTMTRTVYSVSKGRSAREDRYVNLYRKYERAVKSLVLAIDPRWDVFYSLPTEKAYKTALTASRFMRWFWMLPDSTSEGGKNMRTKLKDLVALGYRRGKAHFEVSTTDYKGTVIPHVEVVDPFDLLISPNGDYRIKSYNITLETLKLLFPSKWKKVTADNEYIASISDNKYDVVGSKQSTGDKNYDALQVVLLHDCFIKEHTKEGTRIRLIKWHKKSNTILENELLDGIDDFPFVDYTPEADNNRLYPNPISADYVDIIKMMNRMYNHISEWVSIVAHGRWMVEKGTKINMTNQEGQILEIDRDKMPPTPVAVPSLPPQVSEFMRYQDELLRDMSGVTQEAMGKQSYAGMPAKSVLALQASAENNTSEPLDNLKTCLEHLGIKVLEYAENYMDAELDIHEVDQEKNIKRSRIRGAKSPNADTESKFIDENDVMMSVREPSNRVNGFDLPLPDDVKELLPPDIVEEPIEKDVINLKVPDLIKVEILPGGTFSKMARDQMIMDLGKAGIIDQTTILQELGGFSSIQDIVLRTQKEKMLNLQPKQQQLPQPNPMNPTQQPMPNSQNMQPMPEMSSPIGQ